MQCSVVFSVRKKFSKIAREVRLFASESTTLADGLEISDAQTLWHICSSIWDVSIRSYLLQVLRVQFNPPP